MAVGPVERFVAVEEGLNEIFPSWKFGETPERIAKRGSVDHGLDTGIKAVNIYPKNKLGVGAGGDLKARFGFIVRGNEEKQASVERRFGAFHRKTDPEPKLGG